MSFIPCLIRSSTAAGEARFELGDPLVDRYLEFVAGRARPNTLRAIAFDLKTFFAVVGKDPLRVEAADVFEFLAQQRGDRAVIRVSDRESGLSARTIVRRLSSVVGGGHVREVRGSGLWGARSVRHHATRSRADRRIGRGGDLTFARVARPPSVASVTSSTPCKTAVCASRTGGPWLAGCS
jgi:hypothetical protein